MIKIFSQSFRDLSIIELTEQKRLVIACDSSAGIGSKSMDKVAVSPEVTAAFCLRVPLLELLCFGALPISVCDLIGNEYEVTGKKMIRGIKAELARADLSDVILNGSTEENMVNELTSIGVTVIGTMAANVTFPQVEKNAVLFQLGEPLVGSEVVRKRSSIFSYALVRQLHRQKGVLDMVPVGSKGIGYEAELMAEISHCSVDLAQTGQLEKSAGPATVILIAVANQHADEVAAQFPTIKKIGIFK